MFMKSNNIVQQHFSSITITTSHKYLLLHFVLFGFGGKGRMPCSVLKGLPSPCISKRASISVLAGGIGP
jgi:hypothetical protein